jgi:hypothetical protein
MRGIGYGATLRDASETANPPRGGAQSHGPLRGSRLPKGARDPINAGGSQTHNVTGSLPFDPTAGFYQYPFDYAPGSVTFSADGQQIQYWDTGFPQTSMHLMLNSWFPRWLGGRRPNKTAYAYEDRGRLRGPDRIRSPAAVSF